MMKKIFLIVSFLFVCANAFTQSRGTTPGFHGRSGPSVVPEDYFHAARDAAYMPRYNDTTQANATIQKDTLGNVIFVYATMSLHVRSMNGASKYWKEMGSGGGGPGGDNIYNSDGTLTEDRTLDGGGFNLTFENVANFIVRVDALGNTRLQIDASVSALYSEDASSSLAVSNTGVSIQGSTILNSLAGNGVGVVTIDNTGTLGWGSFINSQFQRFSNVFPSDTTEGQQNLRNDQGATYLMPNGDLVTVCNRFGASSGDLTASSIYAIRSTDGGVTWGTPYILVGDGTNSYQSASVHVQEDGDVILIYQKKTSVWSLERRISTNSLLTVGAATTIYGTTTKKLSQAPDRILKLHTGVLRYPVSERTVAGGESSVGLFLTSTDDGNSWSTMGTTLTFADSSYQEPGMVEYIDKYTGQYVVDLYWRTDRTIKAQYRQTTDIADFATWSSERFFGFYNVTATITVKYDSINDVFWRVSNRIMPPPAPDTTSANTFDRGFLDLYSTRRTQGYYGWTQVMNVDYDTIQSQFAFFEPSIFLYQDKIAINYSKYICYPVTCSGTFRYDLLWRMVPVSSVLPMTDWVDANYLSVRGLIERQKYTGGGGLTYRKLAHFYNNENRPWLGGFFIDNNHDLGNIDADAISFYWKTYGTTRPIVFNIDKESYQTAFPFLDIQFSSNDIGTGINTNQQVMQIGMKAASEPIVRFFQNKVQYFQRIQLDSRTTAQITAYGNIAAAQVAWNSDSLRPGVYNGSAWKYFAYTTDIAGGGGGGVSDGDKGDITVASSGSVWTIDNSVVTYAKIQNVTQATLLGRYTASNGVVQEITLGSGLSLNNSTGELTASGGGGGGSGTVNSGTQFQLAYYATSGTAVSGLTLITASRALASDANGLPVATTVTTTELERLSGVTSAIQTQIDSKLAHTTASPALNGTSASGLGVVPTSMYSSLTADNPLSDVNTAQNVFPSSGDVWTLQASTTYEFEGTYHITSGATSHSVGMGFALGGGASFTSIAYTAISIHANSQLSATQNMVQVTTGNNTLVVAAAAADNSVVIFKGIMRINAGGTVTPQITFSAATGATPNLKSNSYIKFTPIGTNTFTTIGSVN